MPDSLLSSPLTWTLAGFCSTLQCTWQGDPDGEGGSSGRSSSSGKWDSGSSSSPSSTSTGLELTDIPCALTSSLGNTRSFFGHFDPCESQCSSSDCKVGLVVVSSAPRGDRWSLSSPGPHRRAGPAFHFVRSEMRMATRVAFLAARCNRSHPDAVPCGWPLPAASRSHRRR